VVACIVLMILQTVSIFFKTLATLRATWGGKAA